MKRPDRLLPSVKSTINTEDPLVRRGVSYTAQYTPDYISALKVIGDRERVTIEIIAEEGETFENNFTREKIKVVTGFRAVRVSSDLPDLSDYHRNVEELMNRRDTMRQEQG